MNNSIITIIAALSQHKRLSMNRKCGKLCVLIEHPQTKHQTMHIYLICRCFFIPLPKLRSHPVYGHSNHMYTLCQAWKLAAQKLSKEIFQFCQIPFTHWWCQDVQVRYKNVINFLLCRMWESKSSVACAMQYSSNVVIASTIAQAVWYIWCFMWSS